MDDYAIDCQNITKKFGNFIAVDSINLKVKTGEIFGFLGPNGAGKTTTIKMLTTLLAPTSGKAKVASFDLRKQDALIRSKIGIVPQEFALFEELTPMENLWYIGELYSMKKNDVEQRSIELLKVVQLYDKKDVQCEGFSGGMKQRLSVAAGLLHKPKILFMDEPTTGLDPQSRIALRELTKKLNSSGITIIYTTHDMEEADKLCNRIAIIDHGKLMALGTPNELKEAHGGGFRIEIELGEHEPKIPNELKKLANAESVEEKEGKIIMVVKNPKKGIMHSISKFMEKNRVEINELFVQDPSLENVFINLTSKNLRD